MQTDNTFQSIAQDILNSPVAEKLRQRDLDALTQIAAGTVDPQTFTLGIGPEGSWSNSVELKIKQVTDATPLVDEATGDVYRSFSVQFNVSWGSLNGEFTDLSHARAMLEDRCSIVALAESLREKYGNKMYNAFVRSAADETQRKLDVEKQKFTRQVNTLAEHAVKGLRVGGKRRELPKAIFAGIPDGSYEFTVHSSNYNADSKKYTVRINAYGAYVIRTQ